MFTTQSNQQNLNYKTNEPKEHDNNVFFDMKRNSENIKFNQDKKHISRNTAQHNKKLILRT